MRQTQLNHPSKEISDEETLSEAEGKLKHYKSKVSEYEHKVCRLKKLKQENEENQLVMNVRQPIDITTYKRNNMVTRPSSKDFTSRSGRDINSYFENVENAKQQIVNCDEIKSKEDTLQNIRKNAQNIKMPVRRDQSIVDSISTKSEIPNRGYSRPSILKTNKEMLDEKINWDYSDDENEHLQDIVDTSNLKEQVQCRNQIASKDIEKVSQKINIRNQRFVNESIYESIVTDDESVSEDRQQVDGKDETYEEVCKPKSNSIRCHRCTNRIDLSKKSNMHAKKKNSNIITQEEKRLLKILAKKILVSEDEEDSVSDECNDENSKRALSERTFSSQNEHSTEKSHLTAKSKSISNTCENTKKVSFKKKSEILTESLRTKIKNLPSMTDENDHNEEIPTGFESDHETIRDTEDESSVYDLSNNDDSDNDSSNERETNNMPHVDNSGNLVIPEYLELQISSDTRKPLTNWPREDDYKLLYLLKRMPQKEYEKKKWKWLADRMEDCSYTNTEIRNHVSLIFL